MYCSACGQPLDVRQAACQKCGRPVAAIASAILPNLQNRVHRHLQVVAILWIAYSVWMLLHWAIAVAFLAGGFNSWAHVGQGLGEPNALPFMHAAWLLPLITALLIGPAILSVVAGISLLHRAPWGRAFAIVTAFLTILRPLSGTVLAIYALWILLPAASRQEYEQMVEGR